MSNMSYCRFQNTLSDLEDCLQALQEEGIENLSPDEKRAALRLIEISKEISEDFS